MFLFPFHLLSLSARTDNKIPTLNKKYRNLLSHCSNIILTFSCVSDIFYSEHFPKQPQIVVCKLGIYLIQNISKKFRKHETTQKHKFSIIWRFWTGCWLFLTNRLLGNYVDFFLYWDFWIFHEVAILMQNNHQSRLRTEPDSTRSTIRLPPFLSNPPNLGSSC